MALSAVELAAQIRQTAAFIAADVVTITVARGDRLRVPGGGFGVAEPAAAGTRAVRIIPGTGRTEALDPQVSSRNETERCILMAMPGTDILEGDQFQFRGTSWEVATVTPKEYELKAEVVNRA